MDSKPKVVTNRVSDVVRRTGEAQVILPVWLIVVEHAGKRHLVGINGQTGKMAANLPVNKEKQTEEARRTAKRKPPIVLLSALPFIVLGAFAFLLFGSYLIEEILDLVNGTQSHNKAWSGFGIELSIAACAAIVYFGV